MDFHQNVHVDKLQCKLRPKLRKGKLKVHNDVEIEPMLQPINGEVVNGMAGDNARSDIRARGVWRQGQTLSLM